MLKTNKKRSELRFLVALSDDTIEIHVVAELAIGTNRGHRVFEEHLVHAVGLENDCEAIEVLDAATELRAVDEIDGHVNTLSAGVVQEAVLHVRRRFLHEVSPDSAGARAFEGIAARSRGRVARLRFRETTRLPLRAGTKSFAAWRIVT